MDPELIATLVAQALSLAMTIYQQYKASQTAAGLPVKTIAEFLAEADANFQQIADTATAQIAESTV